jgi:AAA domain
MSAAWPEPEGGYRLITQIAEPSEKWALEEPPKPRRRSAWSDGLDEIGPIQVLGALSRVAALERITARSTEWRVRGILTSDDYGVLAGPKGVGKTFALLDLGVSVALGDPWFGRFETEQARVLVLTSEDPEPRLWQRIDAIARAGGHDPGELEGWLYVHPIPFNAITDISKLEAELAVLGPGLVVLDPAYKYLVGAKASSLFDMGAALTPLQVACAEAGTALLVGHHYNRQQGRAREERISGAGLLEWARVVITVDGMPRAGEMAHIMFEITGNSLDPIAFNLRRGVVPLDESPNPELSYSVEVIAEGDEAITARYLKAADRVYAVLPDTPEEAVTVKVIGDRLVADDTGKGPMKADTIRKALNRDLEGRVDVLDGRWWRT